ncbi:MAG: hypothetical protein R3275_09755 [Saprospiraceae bacterium]|nr:hypothetical protein [Saprospiraceae bacterium]
MARHPGNLNLSLPGISGERLKGMLPDIIFSTTSACNSGSARPSYVLTALGSLSEEELNGAFRIGVGKYNTEEEIDYAASQITASYRKVIHNDLITI